MTTHNESSQPSKRRLAVLALIIAGFLLFAGGIGFMAGRATSPHPSDGAMSSTPTLSRPEVAAPREPISTPTPLPSPAPVVTVAPTESIPNDDNASFFEQILLPLYQSGIEQRDQTKLDTVMNVLDEAKRLQPTLPDEWERLWRASAYAMDALQGSFYLQPQDVGQFTLTTEQGEALVQPIDMTVVDDHLYVIDSGALYRSDLPQIGAGATATLTMTAILTPTAWIQGFPVKEIVAVDGQNIDHGLYVLDKSNDLFFLDATSGEWSLHSPQARKLSRPDPHFLNITTYANRLYLLDTSRNQIWRYPPNELGAAYLNSNLLWLQAENDPNVTSGIDMAVDGTIFVLNRDGEIAQYAPDLLQTFSIDAAADRTHFQEWERAPARPIALFLDPDDASLFVADPGRRRVVVLNREDGSFIQQYIFAGNPAFDRLHAVSVQNDVLYMLAGAHLYIHAIPQDDAPISLQGSMPAFPPPTWDLNAVTLLDVPPNDPRVPALLARYQLTWPMTGTVLPDQFVLYPGARRAYRYGVHQGMDLYYEEPDRRVVVGSPVRAAGAGVVVRADIDYQEMTLAEVNALLADAHARHITPPHTLDKLGGRQVWIDHGDGLMTKYEHLNGIADGLVVGDHVEKGQLIGYAGLSGTPDGIEGNLSFPHLHFEIRIGPDHIYYLGQWLTIEETRRMLERLFSSKPEE